MNKEAKYRGKRKDTGEWVYGYYFKSVNDRDYIVSYATEEVVNTTNEIDFLYNEVIPETVGQYTDIKDEESEEIYEGDILRYENYYKGLKPTGETEWDAFCIVEWDNERARFATSEIDGNKYCFSSYAINTYCEVIGNIHESKDLLDNS